MFHSPRRFGPTLRLALARRPWIRWLGIGGAALLAGWLILGQLQQVDAARRSWTDQRTVFVAARDHAPGDVLTVEQRSLPRVAIPPAALDESPSGTPARQHVSAGEIVTSDDVAMATGPAAVAQSDEIVVAISDPLLQGAMSTVVVGLAVDVHSDGIVLAASARVAAVDGDVVFVAVARREAPSVSAAAQMRNASLAFLP